MHAQIRVLNARSRKLLYNWKIMERENMSAPFLSLSLINRFDYPAHHEGRQPFRQGLAYYPEWRSQTLKGGAVGDACMP